jgi:hypothetical protein
MVLPMRRRRWLRAVLITAGTKLQPEQACV